MSTPPFSTGNLHLSCWGVRVGCWEGDLSHLVHKCPGVAASGLHQAGDPEDAIPELCGSGKSGTLSWCYRGTRPWGTSEEGQVYLAFGRI